MEAAYEKNTKFFKKQKLKQVINTRSKPIKKEIGIFDVFWVKYVSCMFGSTKESLVCFNSS